MPYFSRLTDIVTCSLSALLESAADPRTAIVEIIREMEEGVAGAQRSVKTAAQSVTRLESEIGTQQSQVAAWLTQARQSLSQGDEMQARRALLRKTEIEDLIAGLEQQLHAAVVTRDHLKTTHHALEARLADAFRRRRELETDPVEDSRAAETTAHFPGSKARMSKVDSELEELRRQLNAGE